MTTFPTISGRAPTAVCRPVAAVEHGFCSGGPAAGPVPMGPAATSFSPT
jgi:hypothetical protein